MGEDAKHILKDVDGRYWEEDSKGMWTCPHDASFDKLTFTALISRYGPIRIFVELTR